MKIIGITGGIGAGKSTVLGILKEEYGAYIVETDILAHRLMEPNQVAYIKIIDNFGKDILDENNRINRSKLGEIVFRNHDMLEQLNKIVHPEVKNYILADIQNKKNEGIIQYYVIEAALLIEDGYKRICDELWYVYANKEKRIERLLKTRGGNYQKWMNVINNQSKDDFYKQHCDIIIDNGKNLKNTVLQINGLLS